MGDCRQRINNANIPSRRQVFCIRKSFGHFHGDADDDGGNVDDDDGSDYDYASFVTFYIFFQQSHELKKCHDNLDLLKGQQVPDLSFSKSIT